MFNSEISFDRALALANRLASSRGSREDKLKKLFFLAYGRPATNAELTTTEKHWQAMTRRHQTLSFVTPKYPREVLREAVEENTGERFEFVEPLEFYADFVPDLKPADVSPVVRGLAEVCLVVLNSNEFVYVY